MSAPRRVAVVHDWLLDYAGSERVLAEILRCFPQADLFALVDRLEPAGRAALGGRRASTTFLQRMPGLSLERLKYFLPLMPLAIEQLDLGTYDLVLSSSHAVAKGVIVPPDALHLSYVHSPMRYAWDLQGAYLRAEGLEGLASVPLRWMLYRLRAWDRASATGVDHFAANSRFVAGRIRKAYGRDATVIPPPVDTEFFTPGGERGEEYVSVSRLIGYKRADLLLEAFALLPERRLLLIGDGPELARLRRRAPPNVRLAGPQPADALRAALRAARAFVFCAVEDFGIAPVEAMACGTPVVALRRGGVAETVAGLQDAAPTGVFFEEQTAASLAAAVREFEAERRSMTEAACRARAEQYSAARFRERYTSWVEQRLGEWRRGSTR